MNSLAEVSDYLCICNISCSQSINISDNNISVVIAATVEAPSNLPDGLECIHVPIDDKPTMDIAQHFDRVSDAISRAKARGEKALVYCVAGVSRSATLVLGALMSISGTNLREAHSILKSKRPFVRPNHGFWSQLCERELQLFGHNSVVMVASAIGAIPDLYREDVEGMVPV